MKPGHDYIDRAEAMRIVELHAPKTCTELVSRLPKFTEPEEVSTQSALVRIAEIIDGQRTTADAASEILRVIGVAPTAQLRIALETDNKRLRDGLAAAVAESKGATETAAATGAKVDEATARAEAAEKNAGQWETLARHWRDKAESALALIKLSKRGKKS